MSDVGLPGFAQPVADAQACFRAVLDAMAHPGRIRRAGIDLRAPHPLAPATAAVLLTLADAETPLWLDPDAGAAASWVQFHCGATFVPMASAQFAVCLSLPPLAAFDWGTHDGPETSATVILQMPSLEGGPRLRLSGPGLQTPETVCLGPLPGDFVTEWRANHAAYPRGIDLVLCSGMQIAALPRSLSVEAA